MKIISASYGVQFAETGFPMPNVEIAIRNVAGQIKVAKNGEIIASFHSDSVATCAASAFKQELVNLYGKIYGRVGAEADRVGLYNEIKRFV